MKLYKLFIMSGLMCLAFNAGASEAESSNQGDSSKGRVVEVFTKGDKKLVLYSERHEMSPAQEAELARMAEKFKNSGGTIINEGEEPSEQEMVENDRAAFLQKEAARNQALEAAYIAYLQRAAREKSDLEKALEAQGYTKIKNNN